MSIAATQSYNEALLDWMNQGKDIDEFDAWWNSQGGGAPDPTDLVSSDEIDYVQPVEPEADTTESPGGVDVQPGLDWLQTQEGFALEKYIAELQARVNREQIANQTDIANINAASRAASDAANARLQKDLQSGRIDADKYLQQRELLQRENEFSRNHALNLRAQDHQERIDEANLELDRAREYREERLLHAELASNPADTVLYEFFKRGLGTPEALQGGGVGGTGAGAIADTLGGFLNGGPTLSGVDYTPPPPAYSDEALQQLADTVFGGAGGGAGYNPNLSGIGAFGAEIKAPNQISRNQFLGMDPSQLGILASFLKGGIQTVPGDDASRVAINPEDYLTQLINSFIPTIESVGGATTTQYAV